jgi:hypothetical protein
MRTIHTNIRFIWGVMICLISMASCDQTALPPNANVSGASLLQFRCVDLTDKEQIRVAPLEQCGCLTSELTEEGQRQVSYIGRERCVEDNPFQVVGYLGSPALQKIAVMHLDKGPRAILDQNKGIPGISHYNADDLLSELLVHPYGDFMFTINYTEGIISISSDHRHLRPDIQIDLGLGPISDAEIWPTIHQALPNDNHQALLYVSSALDHQVYELDLDLVSLELERAIAGEEVQVSELMRRSWPISNLEDEPRSPSLLSVNERGDQLAVTIRGEMLIQLIDLKSDEQLSNTRHITVKTRSFCDDSYLTDIMSESNAHETCADGVDNDGNGVQDANDDQCQKYNIEAIKISCPQLDQCHDLIDNDNDGLIDEEDLDCAEIHQGLRPSRESAPPECDDGIDNDGDGLIDRADLGCQNQDDQSEAMTPEVSSCFDGLDNDNDGDIDAIDDDCQTNDSPQYRGQFPGEGTDLCTDGLDNDSDGLVDYEDPGCTDKNAAKLYGFERQSECADLLDNDGDGLIDYGEDPDCYSATDARELNERLAKDIGLIKLVSLSTSDGDRDMLLTHDEGGTLVIFELASNLQYRSRAISEIRFPHTIEIRATGNLKTAWLIDQSNTLSSVHLTAPKPLTVSGQYSVYARGVISDILDQNNDPNSERLAPHAIEAVAFYIVRDGTAYHLNILDDFTGRLNYDPYTDVPLVTAEAEALISSLSADELNALDTLALPEGIGGFGDPQVFIDGPYQISNERWNRNRTAIGQANRVAEPAQFFMSGIKISSNKSRHAGFCAITRNENLEDMSPNCVLVGSDTIGGAERTQDGTKRRASQLEFYEGILVHQEDPTKMISGAVNISYEGTIPGSRKRTGLHISTENDVWHFADYRADFCSMGVEAGDLLVAERFYPFNEQSAKDPECAPYLNRSPSEGEDPLRFRIQSVSQHGLTLAQDDRLSYSPQLDLLGSSRLPKLAPSLPPPPYRCAAQSISYSIRAGNDQWLVDTQALGFVHPWSSRNGHCIQSTKKLAEGWSGRAQLGEFFKNPWFSFKLGYQQASVGVSGIPQDQLPTMVGSSFNFTLTRGALNALILGVGVLPNELRWLPERDRLYLVDAALKSVTEYEGVDPYLNTLKIVQSFQ